VIKEGRGGEQKKGFELWCSTATGGKRRTEGPKRWESEKLGGEKKKQKGTRQAVKRNGLVLLTDKGKITLGAGGKGMGAQKGKSRNREKLPSTTRGGELDGDKKKDKRVRRSRRRGKL